MGNVRLTDLREPVMPIDFSCCYCGARWRAAHDSGGKPAQCGRCGRAITIPQAEPTAEPIDSSDACADDYCGNCGAVAHSDQSTCSRCGCDRQEDQSCHRELTELETPADDHGKPTEQIETTSQYTQQTGTIRSMFNISTDEFRITMARYTGGPGRRVSLLPPLRLKIYASGQIEIAGKNVDNTKGIVSLIVLLAGAAFMALTDARAGVEFAVTSILLLAFFFFALKLEYDDCYRLIENGKIAYNDHKQWFSIQTEADQWISFRPRSAQTNYQPIKTIFQQMIGPRLIMRA